MKPGQQVGFAEASPVQCRLNPSFSWKKLASGCIILDLEKGHYFTLNETATLIWSGLVEAKDWGTIAAELAREYNISRDQADKDVKEVFDTLMAESVLISLSQNQPSTTQPTEK